MSSAWARELGTGTQENERGPGEAEVVVVVHTRHRLRILRSMRAGRTGKVRSLGFSSHGIQAASTSTVAIAVGKEICGGGGALQRGVVPSIVGHQSN